MSPSEPPQIRCEFDSLEEPIRGWVRDDHGLALPFQGWIGLVAALRTASGGEASITTEPQGGHPS